MHNQMLLFFLAILASAVVYAAFYKWVDEDGVTQYSNVAPPGRGAVVRVPPGPAPQQVRESSERVQRMLDGLRQRAEPGDEEDTIRDWSDETGPQELAGLTTQCLRGKRLLHTFRTARPVYRFNARCERVYVSDDDRRMVVGLAQKLVDKTCDGKIDPQRLGEILVVQSEIRAFDERYRQMPGESNGYPDFVELRSSPALCRCAGVFLAEMANPRYRTPKAEVDKAREMIRARCPQ